MMMGCKGKICVNYLKELKMLKANYHSERSFKPNTMKNSRSYVIIWAFGSSFSKVVYTISWNPHFTSNWSCKMTRGLYTSDDCTGESNTRV